MNRLAREKSPYLLQHADNPVDWYPWGDEAFAAARAQNKPIFLSIGYSTCHWCHVMAHESFEDPAAAAVMNQHFINIKIDREERPDVDAIYMNAVQMISGSGGWPMSVWLTPDLKPFYAGTYFPPDDRYGRPGFKAVLMQINEVWEKEKEKLVASSDEITALISQNQKTAASPESGVNTSELLTKNFLSLKSMFDPHHGGFARAPKFPMPVYLHFLLDVYRRTGQRDALDMVIATMRAMRRGGIYDQLGGGFARYSTDERWVVPHFEKMLYDNAQLISVAAELCGITQDQYFRDTTEHAIAYVLRDLTHSSGAFYSAEDADSEGKEGTFYIWTLKEITELLSPAEAEAAVYYFGVSPNGNFFDPHTGDSGKNVLVLARSIEETATHCKKSPSEMTTILNQVKEKLLAARARRPRPHLDDKILTEWNGLMISALARASKFLNRADYAECAQRAADFIYKNLYDPASAHLYRRWRDNDRQIEAQQADYAMLIQGLLDLFEATGTARWLEWASRLQKIQDELFFDSTLGGYFMNVSRPDLVARLKDDTDNVIPSGNSIAVLNGVRLSKLLDIKEFHIAAEKTARFFAEKLNAHPGSLTAMVSAIAHMQEPARQLIIVGESEKADTRQLISVAAGSPLHPLVYFVVSPGAPQEELGKLLPFIKSMSLTNGGATAYLCENHTCQAPTADPEALKRALEASARKK